MRPLWYWKHLIFSLLVCVILFELSIYQIEHRPVFQKYSVVSINISVVSINISQPSSNFIHSDRTIINSSLMCRNKSIIFGANHKTGSQMFCKVLFPIFRHALTRICPLNTHSFVWNNHFSAKVLNDIINRTKSSTDETYSFIAFNLIRSPVSTVLSGYNYHTITDEREIGQTALNLNLNRYPTKFFLFICEPIFEMLMLYNTSYGNSTLKDIYNDNNVSFGLDLEYKRYNACEYKRINSIYHHANNNIQMHHYRLEYLQRNFDQIMQKIMNALQIFEPRKRHSLLRRLRHARDVEMNGTHATSGTYNKTQQLNILLSNAERCRALKEQTISLDYQWLFQEYC